MAFCEHAQLPRAPLPGRALPLDSPRGSVCRHDCSLRDRSSPSLSCVWNDNIELGKHSFTRINSLGPGSHCGDGAGGFCVLRTQRSQKALFHLGLAFLPLLCLSAFLLPFLLPFFHPSTPTSNNYSSSQLPDFKDENVDFLLPARH